VFEHDEFRWFVASLRNREQSAHAEAFHVFAFEYLHFHAITFGKLARLVSEIAWRTHVGRQVAQIFRERHALRDC
jgi:hypothetical protein